LTDFIQVEKMHSNKARHDETQAIRNAKRRRDGHWQGVVAEKDTTITEQAALISELQAQLAKK